jgi:hypothetical protein
MGVLISLALFNARTTQFAFTLAGRENDARRESLITRKALLRQILGWILDIIRSEWMSSLGNPATAVGTRDEERTRELMDKECSFMAIRKRPPEDV